jgi:phage/plasmid-like protein (TIGR03299 family)
LRRSADHVLGTDIRQATDIGDALQLAGLDWGVTTVDDTDGLSIGMGAAEQSVFMPDRKLIVRDDQPIVLGMVSSSYAPLGNQTAFAPADKARELGAVFSSAGESDYGRKSWVTMDLPEAEVMIGGKDAVRFQIEFRTSHSGDGAVSGRVRGRRLWCLNGCSARLHSPAQWSVRHTDSAEDRLMLAATTIRGAVQWAKEFAALGEQLISTPMPLPMYERYIDTIYPRPDESRKVAVEKWERRRADLMGLFRTSQLQADGRGSLWAGVNSVTEYEQWWRAARSDESRARRQFDGASDRFSAQAFALAGDLIST